MGTNELPWTPTSKIWHLELTQDHLDTEDTEGNRRSLCLFFPNPYNMGVYGLPWTPTSKIGQFELTQDHLDTDATKVTFLFQIPTIWVSTDSPGPKQSRFGILSWLRTTWTLGTLRVSGGYFAFFVPNPYNILPGHKIWSRFDILSWIRTTWTLRTPMVCIGHFVFFVPNPYNGCNCLWTPLYPSSQDSAFWADLR